MKKNKLAIIVLLSVLCVASAVACAVSYFSLQRATERNARLLDDYRHSVTEMKTDVLTNLPNRDSLFIFFNRQLENIKRTDSIAVIHVRSTGATRGIKFVNDNYGHFAGSIFLVDLGKAITSSFADNGCNVFYNGVSFCVIMNSPTRERIENCMKKLDSLWFNKPYALSDTAFCPSQFVSVAFCPSQGTDINDLLYSLHKSVDKTDDYYFGYLKNSDN